LAAVASAALWHTLALAAPAAAKASAPWSVPPGARLQYEVRGESHGLGYRAEAELRWQSAAPQYQATLTLSAWLVGSRRQHSSGTLDAWGLRPLHFSDKARRERWLQFDWATAPAGPARVLTDRGTRIDAVPAGAQDRLGVFVQLGGLLLATPPARPGQRWTLPVVSGAGVENWTFEYRGSEALELPAGRMTAWHLQRVDAPGKATAVDVWYSPAPAGLPVRLVLQQDGGERVDQRLRAWTTDP
jgi:hypothetical protein